MILLTAFGLALVDGCTRNIAVGPTYLPPGRTFTPTISPTITLTPTITSTPTTTTTTTSTITNTPTVTQTPTTTSTPSNTPTPTPYVLYEDFEGGPWPIPAQAANYLFTFTSGNPGTSINPSYDSVNYSPIDIVPGNSLALAVTYTVSNDSVIGELFSQYGMPNASGAITLNCMLNGTTPPGNLNFWVKSSSLVGMQLYIFDALWAGGIPGPDISLNNTPIYPTVGTWTRVIVPLTNPPWDTNISTIDYTQIAGIVFVFVGPASGAFPLGLQINIDDIYFTP
jgi:hypothetical protein